MNHFLCCHYDFSYLHHTTMFKARGKTFIFHIAKLFNNTIKNIKTKRILKMNIHMSFIIKFTSNLQLRHGDVTLAQ
jgi:hypothetical protein